MFPQLRLTSARAAFARPGPRATAFPDVNAPMQPSDSLAPFGRRSGRPSQNGLPRCAGLVLHRRTGASADRCNAGDISTPAPHKPALSRGETRGSQVPGPSSSGVPWSTTPPGAYRPSPISRCGRRRLQTNRSPRHPASLPISGLPTHGPHARVPTHRRTRYRSRRKARYRPGWAHPWPGGIRTRWMTNKVS